ncbi:MULTISPECIES: LLM class flavin-dependent oxidoreductase [unclassified Mycobacterium]|uniref:LLM class flavin-dependent oxidoreductase n=1 Tax=unclassified Mycobacterium TaxID=2642494 RepID=UPI0029C73633|nr:MULTISPECIES: LLM class flavin-dependent oxidoreductase [unclassified Mycobacterium]
METIFLSLGDNVRDPVDGETLTDAQKHQRLIEQAVAVEHAGFDVIQLGEHHFNHFVFAAPEVVLAAIAQHTTRLRLGTGVTTITTLDPVLVAEGFATLDVMSGGRAEIALGRGAYEQTFQAMGRPQEHATLIFEEFVELLWQLFNEEEITWKGDWRAALDGITVRPRPVQESIPMWNSSTSSVALSARLGLGAEWVAALAPFDSLKPYADEFREAWARAGRAPASWRLRLGVHFHVAKTSQQARTDFEPYHSNYLRENAKLRISAYQRRWLKPDEEVDREHIMIKPEGDIIPFCGSPAELVDKIGRAREVLGISGVAMAIDMGGMPQHKVLNQIDLVGSEVIPALN